MEFCIHAKCLKIPISNKKKMLVVSESTDFWDTAGQERFQSMHPSYYHKAHACIMVSENDQ